MIHKLLESYELREQYSDALLVRENRLAADTLQIVWIINLGVDFVPMLVELPDTNSYWIKIWNLLRADH